MQRYNPDAIRGLRRELGLTKADFGRKLGVTKQYVHQLELGQRKPNVRTLERIMEAYGVESALFFAPVPASAQEQDEKRRPAWDRDNRGLFGR